jgi:hypothetical protein
MKKLFTILTLFIMLLSTLLLTGCTTKKDSVVIYSCMEENRNLELKKQLKEKFPNLNVIVQYMPTGNSSAKIKTEGTNVEADIILDLGSRPDIWGQNNKEPYIYVSDINLKKSDIQIIGARKDTVKFEKFGVVYIKFFAKDLIAELENYDEIKMEVVGKANLNEWAGRVTPQIMIENYEIKDNEYGF